MFAHPYCLSLSVCLTSVYGILLGRQKGRNVEVCNSYELVVNTVDGRLVLDKEYFAAKEDQCKRNDSVRVVFQMYLEASIKIFQVSWISFILSASIVIPLDATIFNHYNYQHFCKL